MGLPERLRVTKKMRELLADKNMKGNLSTLKFATPTQRVEILLAKALDNAVSKLLSQNLTGHEGVMV